MARGALFGHSSGGTVLHRTICVYDEFLGKRLLALLVKL